MLLQSRKKQGYEKVSLTRNYIRPHYKRIQKAIFVVLQSAAAANDSVHLAMLFKMYTNERNKFWFNMHLSCTESSNHSRTGG